MNICDVTTAKRDGDFKTIIQMFFFFLIRFTFYALNMDDMEKVKKALYMFVDLFGLDRFEFETLVRFTITVKKNYRQVCQICTDKSDQTYL